MRWVVYAIGAALATYSVIGGIKMSFAPVYLVVQMPNACTKGGAASYSPPEQEMAVSPPWEMFNE